MNVCCCTVRYEFHNNESKVDDFRIIRNKNSKLVLHSISNENIKSLKYNTNEDTGLTLMKSGAEKPVDILGYRTWSSPYELIVRSYNTTSQNNKRTKGIEIYGYVNMNYEIDLNGVILDLDDEKIEIRGFKNHERLRLDSSSNIDAYVMENDNSLNINDTIIVVYRQNPINNFKVDLDNYNNKINKKLEDRKCVN